MCEQCRKQTEEFREEIAALPKDAKKFEFTAEELMYINACMCLGIIAAFIEPPIDDMSMTLGRKSIAVLDAAGYEKVEDLALKLNHYGAEAIGPEFAKSVTDAVTKIITTIEKISNN